MLRVAREEAFIYLDPAYNCRSYTVKKSEVRKFKELSLLEKLEKLSIPLLDSVVFEQFSLSQGDYIWKVYICSE
jgi:site-specific DNA-adenine methylase